LLTEINCWFKDRTFLAFLVCTAATSVDLVVFLGGEQRLELAMAITKAGNNNFGSGESIEKMYFWR